MPETPPELTAEFILRVLAHTDELRYWGGNSANLAVAKAAAGQAADAYTLARAQRRRFTLLGSSGDDAVTVAQEYGARRRGPQKARVLVVARPRVAAVLSITGSVIEVDDSTYFEAGDTIRIRSEDGSQTEVVTVIAVTTDSGPNGGDEITTTVHTYTYDPAGEDVRVLLRVLLPAGTAITTQTGVAFELLADLYVGDLNPVLDGESEALALADKAWAECVTPGAAGALEPYAVTGLETPNNKIRAVLNPERSAGGVDVEPIFDLKLRASHRAQALAQETEAWLEAVAREGLRDVLRLFVVPSSFASTIGALVVPRNGGMLSPDQLAALRRYLEQRMRSGQAIELDNVTLTAVEITADITLNPGTGTPRERLRAAWKAAADRYAVFFDYRKWRRGEAVDEADLTSILKATPGVRTLVTSTFTPAADVDVGEHSIPIFTRLELTDQTSGITLAGTLTSELS